MHDDDGLKRRKTERRFSKIAKLTPIRIIDRSGSLIRNAIFLQSRDPTIQPISRPTRKSRWASTRVMRGSGPQICRFPKRDGRAGTTLKLGHLPWSLTLTLTRADPSMFSTTVLVLRDRD